MLDNMNVWKYTYIQFFKIRRKVIGECGADDFAAMLFVVLLDCLFYWGIMRISSWLSDSKIKN